MDINNLEKLKAKERSFVLKLTKKDIENLLQKFGYSLNENVYSEENGKKLPAIERGYNEEKKEYQIMLRCLNNDTTAEDLYNTLTIKMPYLVSGGYNPRQSVIMLSDYSITELSLGMENHTDKQLIYARYMYEKFGEFYRDKYNKYVRQEIRESKKEQIEK